MDPQQSAVVTGESGATGGTDGGTGAAQNTGAQTGVVERSHRQGAPSEGGTAPQTNPTSPPQQQPGETADHWRQRYDGLQGNFRQERAQAQAAIQQAEASRVAAEQRAQRAEAAAWQGHWRLSGYSPEQIAQATQNLNQQQQVVAERARVVAERKALQDERAAFYRSTEGPAKEIIVARIAKEEGVDPARIAHLSHPDLMRELAREIRGLGRQTNLQTRRANGTDRAESGGGGGVDVSKMSAHERIKAGLKQFHSTNRR